MNYKTIIVVRLIATTLIAASTAHGSMKQEQVEHFGYGSIAHMDFTYTRSPMAMRKESLTLMRNQRLRLIEIERTDTWMRWQLDPETKSYSESAMVSEQSYRKTEESLRKNDGLIFAAPEPLKDIHPQVEGPGTPIVISGFTCRPYVIKRTKTFRSPENPKQTIIQTEVDKVWATVLTPALTRYRQDEQSFDKAESDKLWGGKDYRKVTGGDPLDEWWEAQGHDNEFVIRRVRLYYRDIAGQTASAGKSNSRLLPAAPPAWALEADPGFAGHLARGDTALLRLITKIDGSDAPADSFKIPAGYKRIQQ